MATEEQQNGGFRRKVRGARALPDHRTRPQRTGDAGSGCRKGQRWLGRRSRSGPTGPLGPARALKAGLRPGTPRRWPRGRRRGQTGADGGRGARGDGAPAGTAPRRGRRPGGDGESRDGGRARKRRTGQPVEAGCPARSCGSRNRVLARRHRAHDRRGSLCGRSRQCAATWAMLPRRGCIGTAPGPLLGAVTAPWVGLRRG
jgi:hypothetical protein